MTKKLKQPDEEVEEPANMCEHCGEVSLALQEWPEYVHENCECRCHHWKSKRGKIEMLEMKAQSRKRKKT